MNFTVNTSATIFGGAPHMVEALLLFFGIVIVVTVVALIRERLK